MSDWTSKLVAAWVAGLSADSLTDDLIATAENCILDCVASAVAGHRTTLAKSVVTTACRQFGSGRSGIWFEPSALTPVGAAFANAAKASALDIDDGNRLATGHPGASVVPAALAAAGESNLSGVDLLVAVVAGYQVAVALAMAEIDKSYHSGNWCGFGAAAAAGRIRNIDTSCLMHALAINAYHGPRCADLTLSRDMGASVKESIPWATVAGMTAVDLACQGFSGCRDAFDVGERFDRDVLRERLENGEAIADTYFKKYAACRWIHAPIEGLLQILDGRGLCHRDIGTVTVATFGQAADLDNLPDPPTLESAQYSIPYCLALAAIKGERALTPLRDSDLHDPAVVGFARRITVRRDPRMDALFPRQAPARVFARTGSRTYEAFVDRPWGEAGGDTGWPDLIEKFQLTADGTLTLDEADAIACAVADLKNGSVGPLLQALAFSRQGEALSSAYAEPSV